MNKTKKAGLPALALACAALLCACAAGASRESAPCPGPDAEEAPQAAAVVEIPQAAGEVPQATAARIGRGPLASAVELPPEDAAALAALLRKGGFNTAGTADCLFDYVLTVGGETFYYHSDCGTFCDTVKQSSLTLTEAERSRVNAMLENDTLPHDTTLPGTVPSA